MSAAPVIETERLILRGHTKADLDDCAAMWGDFPQRLSDATGLGVFAYSRVGYGQSSPATLPPSSRWTTGTAARCSP